MSNRSFVALHMIDADPVGDLPPSLELMRRAMLTEQDVAAGVFVGGRALSLHLSKMAVSVAIEPAPRGLSGSRAEP
jgi:hypothetical protein